MMVETILLNILKFKNNVNIAEIKQILFTTKVKKNSLNGLTKFLTCRNFTIKLQTIFIKFYLGSNSVCHLHRTYWIDLHFVFISLMERRHQWPTFLWKWWHQCQCRHLSHDINWIFCARYSWYWWLRCLISTG